MKIELQVYHLPLLYIGPSVADQDKPYKVQQQPPTDDSGMDKVAVYIWHFVTMVSSSN